MSIKSVYIINPEVGRFAPVRLILLEVLRSLGIEISLTQIIKDEIEEVLGTAIGLEGQITDEEFNKIREAIGKDLAYPVYHLGP